MPNYAFKCKRCDHEFDVTLPMDECSQLQSCPECSSESRRVFTPVGFNLKGDGWVSKNLRVKRQMADRRERAGHRQEEMRRDAPPVKLVPNVEGERAESWSDAKKLARSRGKDSSSYDPMVRKEQAGLV